MTIWNTDYMPTEATYWAPAGDDGYGGLAWSAPVPINCRWEDIAEKFTNANGEELVSSAVVWPDAILATGGFLWRGEYDTGLPLDPREQAGAYEIKKFQRTPELRGDLEEVKAYL
jgi:hypothetical protein